MDTNWNIDKYFSPTEPPARWNLRRAFMETHKKDIPEDRLVSLAQTFCNMEFLGCRYAASLMALVEQLANQVEAVRKYREDKVNSLKRTFILASDAVKKCSNESTCIDAKKFKTDVEEDGVSTSFVSESLSERDYLIKSQQQPGWKGKIVIFEDPNCVQSAYSKCVNACMKAGLTIKIIGTGEVKNLLREYALTIDSESIELCYAENEKKAREQLGPKVLDLFKKYCFTIVTKNKYDGEQIEKQQQSTIPESSTLPENNIGTKMMKSMGWCGQGLGKNQSGIQNPIEIQENVNRLGLGGSKNCKNMIAQINKYLENYIRMQHTHSLVFSPDFTNDERKFIHEAARRLNLQSKSHGKGTNRQLTVQRKLSAWKIVEDLLAVGGSTSKYDLIKPIAL